MQWLTSMELINGIEHASVRHLRTQLDPTFGAAGQSMQSHLHGGQSRHQPRRHGYVQRFVLFLGRATFRG